MEITELSELRRLQDPVEIAPRPLQDPAEKDQDSFAELLTNAVYGVDESMKGSEQKIEDFVAGRTDNVHDVMISMQRAQLSFQMMVEVRNKVIDAYHEISRMQI